MKRSVIALFVFFLSVNVFSQQYDNIVFEDRVYAEGIRSVQLYMDGYDFSHPIIKLNTNDRLHLVFDDLSDDNRYYKYTFIHCTYDWQPDGLNQLEYLDGFMEDEIKDFSYSFNTITKYAKYELLFPNDMLRITKSGNYLLFVYDDNPSNPVLTRRFMIEEPLSARISGEVKQASDVNDMYTKQEVDFTVYTGSYSVRNPAAYLNAVILQNYRWDNAIVGLKYRSGKPGEYSFDYDNGENVFPGGAEFKTFDIATLRSNGDRIVSVGYQNKQNYAYVVEDYARPFGAYELNSTMRGKCYYRNDDFEGVNTEDYVKTFFTLRVDFPVQDGKIYVFGELTDWRIREDAELVLNEKTNRWETSLFIKQGLYNYQYVYVKNGTNLVDATYIEGSHWQTLNEYAVLIYLKEEGTIYDKLVGVTYLTLKNNKQ